LCDELIAIGKMLDEENLIFLFLNGLGSKYYLFVTMSLKPHLEPLNTIMVMVVIIYKI
jgi:hypothetical protein